MFLKLSQVSSYLILNSSSSFHLKNFFIWKSPAPLPSTRSPWPACRPAAPPSPWTASADLPSNSHWYDETLPAVAWAGCSGRWAARTWNGNLLPTHWAIVNQHKPLSFVIQTAVNLVQIVVMDCMVNNRWMMIEGHGTWQADWSLRTVIEGRDCRRGTSLLARRPLVRRNRHWNFVFQVTASRFVLHDFCLQSTDQRGLVLLGLLVRVQTTTIVALLLLQPLAQLLVLPQQGRGRLASSWTTCWTRTRHSIGSRQSAHVKAGFAKRTWERLFTVQTFVTAGSSQRAADRVELE